METSTAYVYYDKGGYDEIKNVQDLVIENGWLKITNEKEMYVYNGTTVSRFVVVKCESPS